MSAAVRRIKLAVLAIVTVFAGVFLFHENVSPFLVTAQTQDPFKGWRPTRVIANVPFVGSHECVSCHTKQGSTHGSMSNASLDPIDSQFLSSLLAANFHSGDYTYTFSRQGDKLIYS